MPHSNNSDKDIDMYGVLFPGNLILLSIWMCDSHVVAMAILVLNCNFF